MVGVGAFLASAPAAQEAESGRRELGRTGYLIIEAARDTSGAFSWSAGPGPGRHSLVWSQGVLSLPDSVRPEPFAFHDVGVVCGPQLAGVGASGRLMLDDGIYAVSEPILLADGVLELHVSGGELEIRGDQIRYRRDVAPSADRQRANYLMVAGLLLLILVLLRRARRRTRGRIRA